MCSAHLWTERTLLTGRFSLSVKCWRKSRTLAEFWWHTTSSKAKSRLVFCGSWRMLASGHTAFWCAPAKRPNRSMSVSLACSRSVLILKFTGTTDSKRRAVRTVWSRPTFMCSPLPTSSGYSRKLTCSQQIRKHCSSECPKSRRRSRTSWRILMGWRRWSKWNVNKNVLAPIWVRSWIIDALFRRRKARSWRR